MSNPYDKRLAALEIRVEESRTTSQKVAEAQVKLNQGQLVDGPAGDLARQFRMALIEIAVANGVTGGTDALLRAAGVKHPSREEIALAEALAARLASESQLAHKE